MSVIAADLPPLDLPPSYRLILLREGGDAFAHACALGSEAGAGTLIWVHRFDVLEFAVVLEPEEPLVSARRAFFAGISALGDAVGSACPPDKPVQFEWPGTLLFDRGRLGGGRLGWPRDCREEEVPRWLVFSAMLLASKHGSGEPGLTPDSTSLEDESCDFSHEGLLASFARNLMRGFHLWNERGFHPIAQDYLSRLALRGKTEARASIADNGDLVLARAACAEDECLAFLPALEEAPWLDRVTGRPRL